MISEWVCVPQAHTRLLRAEYETMWGDILLRISIYMVCFNECRGMHDGEEERKKGEEGNRLSTSLSSY